MADLLLSGPPGSGKSQIARTERARMQADGPVIVADFTELYRAVSLVERGPDGTYPLRDDDLLPLVESTRQRLILTAKERGIDVIATNSRGEPRRREYLARASWAGCCRARHRPRPRCCRCSRLAGPNGGQLSDACATGFRILV